MSSWSAAYRRDEAAQRREERVAQKRRRELERLLKEHAKLNALQQARLEVETHENAIDVLLSVHKEQSPPLAWVKLSAALPPHKPPRLARHEIAAQLQDLRSSIHPINSHEAPEQQARLIEERYREARVLDDKEHETALAAYAQEVDECQNLRSLAQRVLAGEESAFTEAFSALSPFDEIESLGASIRMMVHDRKTIACELKVNGREVVPSEAKTLTSTGKLAVKAMPKVRSHEIYQDHVCACALRLAREIFALLPVETVVVTAVIDGVDSRTGNPAEIPILSIETRHADLQALDFTRLDPSDAVAGLIHRGDVKASRKTGEFIPVIPLTAADVSSYRPQGMALDSLVACVRELRSEIGVLLKSCVVERVVESNIPTT